MAEKKMTDEFKELFLETLSEFPSITGVAKLLMVDPETIRQARKKDKEFDEAVVRAHKYGHDMLEAEAIRRAKDGVKEPVWYKGEQVGYVRKYSDRLLEMLLKRFKPAEYQPQGKLGIDTTDGNVTVTFNIGKEDE